MSTIDDTLNERGKRYGVYRDHAQITQDLKLTMHSTPKWATLAAHQKETLEMVAHKIGRILNGDPNYHDSWHDIAGYAKLSADELLPKSLIPGYAEVVASDNVTQLR